MVNHFWPFVIHALIMLAPVATASDQLSFLAVDTNATNGTSTDVVSTGIASTIASWTSLSSSITSAAGKTVTLTLSAPFDMTGFQTGSYINIGTAQTCITIVGNGAVFDAGGKDRLFVVREAVALVMSNVTLQNGNSRPHGDYGGAIYVGGTVTLSDCTFSGNTAPGSAGGALYFGSNSTGLLKNCSLLGMVSPNKNDIARHDTTTKVTFACADGEVGTPVQMSGTEITKLPAPTCTIASWTSLSSSITSAAGKAVTLMLSAPFDMTGFQSGSAIDIETAQTAITIVGNGAIFDAGGKDRFFIVGQAVVLVMSNVTLQSGNSGNGIGAERYGGAINVFGTVTLSNCIFSGNTAQVGIVRV
jgi:predicted outer membrane repeat protein